MAYYEASANSNIECINTTIYCSFGVNYSGSFSGSATVSKPVKGLGVSSIKFTGGSWGVLMVYL